MSIACPVCRANNEEPPTCRRCKADLTALFDLERLRADHLRQAQAACRTGEWQAARSAIEEARQLRVGSDIDQFDAMIYLMEGDYSRAWELMGKAEQFEKSE